MVPATIGSCAVGYLDSRIASVRGTGFVQGLFVVVGSALGLKPGAGGLSRVRQSGEVFLIDEHLVSAPAGCLSDDPHANQTAQRSRCGRE